ncbi:MAG TPA: hypothetical protein VEU52_02770 [Candidatus Limnocylindrales bacterium]|jgi:hypothetical protein|nr:hypothetical protein [Candidatus Limnocylindrales bacterium]
MKKWAAVWLAMAACLLLAGTAQAQDKAQAKAPAAKSTKDPAADTREKNVREYIELLRSNVRQNKAEIMGAVMQLSAADAAKFWPIYADYTTELTKVNDLRVANIEEYSRTYTDLTDQRADELVQNAMQYQKLRAELLAKYYDRVKQALGGVTAARFLQVESQLLLIIDLQIAASLPLAGQSS